LRLQYTDLFAKDPDDREKQINATITTDHPASSYDQPVVVLEDGGALDYQSAIMLNYRVVEATEEEQVLLTQWQQNMPPIG
jgi:phage baseplate assembly protein gpV